MTPQVIAKLEIAFTDGCSDLEACIVAGISKDALYDYQKITPGFSERKEMLKKNPTLKARRCVVKEIETNPELAMKYLERKERDEFSTKSELNTSLTFTQMPAIEVVNPASPDKPVKLQFKIGD